MIIVQYDIEKGNIDIINNTIKIIEEKNPNEIIIAVPSGMSVAEWSDEDGLEMLENINRLISNIITEIKNKVKRSDYGMNDTIRYLDIQSTSPYYQKAWNKIKSQYGIEVDDE